MIEDERKGFTETDHLRGSNPVFALAEIIHKAMPGDQRPIARLQDWARNINQIVNSVLVLHPVQTEDELISLVFHVDQRTLSRGLFLVASETINASHRHVTQEGHEIDYSLEIPREPEVLKKLITELFGLREDELDNPSLRRRFAHRLPFGSDEDVVLAIAGASKRRKKTGLVTFCQQSERRIGEYTQKGIWSDTVIPGVTAVLRVARKDGTSKTAQPESYELYLWFLNDLSLAGVKPLTPQELADFFPQISNQLKSEVKIFLQLAGFDRNKYLDLPRKAQVTEITRLKKAAGLMQPTGLAEINAYLDEIKPKQDN